MLSVAVVGSVNLDLSARVKRLPEPGETVSGATLDRFPGGKGANQALAARRLGARVTMHACVGEDINADEALHLLAEGEVDLAHVQRDEEAPTGIAMIAVTPTGENQIIVAPGANRKLKAPARELLEADLLISQLETPSGVLAEIVRGFEGFVCVNLAPAREIDVSVLQRADLLVVNETESNWYGMTLEAATGFVATTYGGAGAKLARNGVIVAEATPPDVEVVDTTGAGDTFTAALALKLASGWSAPDALDFACVAGALATTRAGAQPSLPTADEVRELLA